MQDQRARNALTRIERAVASIEAAIADRGGSSAEAEELAALRTAHGKLRGRVERAVGEIDDLLAQRSGGRG